MVIKIITRKDSPIDYTPIVNISSPLSEYEKQYLDDLIKSINQQLETTTKYLQTNEAKHYFREVQRAKDEFFADKNLEYELDYIVSRSFKHTDKFVKAFYEIGAKLGYKDIKRRLKYTPADENALAHLVRYNYELVRNLNNELAYGIKRTIFEGAARGQNPRELIPTIEKLPLKPLQIPLKNGNFRTISTRTPAEMIARTEYARAQCNGKLQAYANYNVEKVDILTCGDELVCDICNYYEHHSPWELRQAAMLLPAHPNCRCTYIAHILDDSIIPSEPVSDPELMNLTHNLNTSNPEKSITLDGVKYKNLGATSEDKLNFLETYGIKKEELTKEELFFIRAYTGPGDSILNNFLRGTDGYSLKESRQKWAKMLNDDFPNEKGISFDRALNIRYHVFNKGKITTEDILLVRRESFDAMMQFSNDNVYHSQGMLSTAITHDIKVEDYGDFRNFLLIPRGSKILYVEGVTETKYDFEVLFPDGSRFQHIPSGLNEKDELWMFIN